VGHSCGVYAVGPVHVNNAESRNWHLRAFLFFKRGVPAALAGFYAAAASAFLRLHAEETLATLPLADRGDTQCNLEPRELG